MTRCFAWSGTTETIPRESGTAKFNEILWLHLLPLASCLLWPPSLVISVIITKDRESNDNVLGLLPWLARLGRREKQIKAFFFSAFPFLIFTTVGRVERIAEVWTELLQVIFSFLRLAKNLDVRLFAHWWRSWWCLKGGTNSKKK